MDKWNKGVAVVTGANSGNGFGILKKIAEAGVTVVGLDIAIDKIEAFRNENRNLKVHSKVCDVTNHETTVDAFRWIEERFGGVDILVNNAGCLKSVGILEHEKPMSELAFNIDLNFTAVVRCARLAYKSMEARETYGYIININSVVGHRVPEFIPGSQIGVYSATKYAITATTESIRQELIQLRNEKVRVTSVSPGVVDTNIFKAGNFNPEVTEAIYQAPHLHPEDIGDTIIYLLSTPSRINIHEITIRATCVSV